MASNAPCVEFTTQPDPKLRFVYETEQTNNRRENKIIAAVKIHGYTGKCRITCSLVTTDDNPKPHPYTLQGSHCVDGVYEIETNITSANNEVKLQGFNIIITKKENFKAKLLERKVDPFQTGVDFDIRQIQIGVVKLCVQVCVYSQQGVPQYLRPECSNPIKNKKKFNDLCINAIIPEECPPDGGASMIMLTSKLPGDPLEVRFYEEAAGRTVWEKICPVRKDEMHHNAAINLKQIPQYAISPESAFKVKIQIRLKDKPSEASNSVDFKYIRARKKERTRALALPDPSTIPDPVPATVDSISSASSYYMSSADSSTSQTRSMVPSSDFDSFPVQVILPRYQESIQEENELQLEMQNYQSMSTSLQVAPQHVGTRRPTQPASATVMEMDTSQYIVSNFQAYREPEPELPTPMPRNNSQPVLLIDDLECQKSPLKIGRRLRDLANKIRLPFDRPSSSEGLSQMIDDSLQTPASYSAVDPLEEILRTSGIQLVSNDAPESSTTGNLVQASSDTDVPHLSYYSDGSNSIPSDVVELILEHQK